MARAFMEEDQEDVDWGDSKLPPPTAPVELAFATSANGPSTITSMTLVSFNLHVVHVEGEVTSVREDPRQIQAGHLPQQMLGDIHE